jgi:acetyl-CoA carboxylase carboxyl transferase subunit beta
LGKKGKTGLWQKCDGCDVPIFRKDLESNLNVCPTCGHHFKMNARERIDLLVDRKSFTEIDESVMSCDPLNFFDKKPYPERLNASIEKTGCNSAVLTGMARIDKMPVAIGALNFAFMGGSMGSVVGEKVTRLIERAAADKIPLIITSMSGGARMQEGILSLMQMAKTSAALGRLREVPAPYLSIMAHPTTAGVAASFAMLGDVNIAEPKALVGFAGPRVIEQTIRQTLPPGFQKSEFVLEHGFLDIVVDRRQLRDTVIKVLRFFVE